MKKIKNNLYWRIYFSAYYFAYNMGEKDSPQINASYFMIVLTITNLSSILFILNFFIKNFPFTLLLFVLAISFSILNLYLIFSKKGYKTKIIDYNYISKVDMKFYRIIHILLSFIISLSIQTITAITLRFINN